MTRSLVRIPAGVRFVFGESARLHRALERTLLDVFEGWSYDEVILPLVDFYDLFARGMGEARAAQSYRFTDREGNLLSLRPDLTSLVARTVAARFSPAPLPIRVCYSGSVFRADESNAGELSEIHQIGLEHIGSDRLEADIEVLLIAIETFEKLGLEEFAITISHAGFFAGVRDSLRLNAEQAASMRQLMDERNTSGLKSFLLEFTSDREASDFCDLVRLAGKEEILDRARRLVSNEKSALALAELASIFSLIEALGVERCVDIDLGDVAGLDYYTGLTMKFYVRGAGGAVGAGGRYDRLMANFGFDQPAVGFSLDLDSLSEIVRRDDLCSARSARKKAPEAVALAANGDLIAVFEAAKRMRLDHKRVEIRTVGAEAR